ncbi:MAG: MFS transporter [Chloroflexi bacterium]|nr:MFS transporter [Chloroflexota bacterium]
MAGPAAVGRFLWDRYSPALGYGDFRHMWLANLFAQAAAWALIVARGWLVYEKTGSSAWVGAVTFAAMVPLVFIPPIAGVLADRMDRRTLLGWTYLINLAHNLALAVLALTGVLTVWHILLLSLVNGVARAAQMPVSQALAANLVPRDKLLNALALNAATMHASRLVGPGLATPLLGLLGAPAAFFLCTVFYGLGWLSIFRIKTQSRGGVKAGESFITNFKGGLSHAWRQPVIRMVIVMVFFHCGLTMAFESLLPVFSAQRLQAGATGFGTLMVGVGAGSLVGSVVVGGVRGSVTRGRLYLVAGVLSGGGLVLLSFMPSTAWAVVATVFMGASQAAFMTLGQAVTQSLAADEYRGRIASLNTLSFGGIMAVMNLANGFLAGHYTAAAIMLAQGFLFVGIVVVSAALATPRRVYVQGLPAEAGA